MLDINGLPILSMREDTETANLYCTRPGLCSPHDVAGPRVTPKGSPHTSFCAPLAHTPLSVVGAPNDRVPMGQHGLRCVSWTVSRHPLASHLTVYGPFKRNSSRCIQAHSTRHCRAR